MLDEMAGHVLDVMLLLALRRRAIRFEQKVLVYVGQREDREGVGDLIPRCFRRVPDTEPEFVVVAGE
ncbi:hypothetical protein HAV15_006239 [Penicillium sp. str. |nr:hypothetical protein HAV15_006239 [Penicillium sp. str. \